MWIPAQNAIYNETATSISTSIYYTPMVRRQKENNDYFEKIYYSFSGVIGNGNITDTGYRLGGAKDIEPALITGNSNDKYTWNISKNPFGSSFDADKSKYNDILGFDSTYEFGNYLNSEYTNMIKSVDKYGGFLVGRYETTRTDSGKVGSKAGENVISNKNWYELYKEQNNRQNNTNVYYGSKS